MRRLPGLILRGMWQVAYRERVVNEHNEEYTYRHISKVQRDAGLLDAQRSCADLLLVADEEGADSRAGPQNTVVVKVCDAVPTSLAFLPLAFTLTLTLTHKLSFTYLPT